MKLPSVARCPIIHCQASTWSVSPSRAAHVRQAIKAAWQSRSANLLYKGDQITNAHRQRYFLKSLALTGELAGGRERPVLAEAVWKLSNGRLY